MEALPDLQVRQHAAEFAEREAKLEAAQKAASRFTEREQHLAQREREVSSREDEVQAASAAADLAKAEAEALWRKSKVSSTALSQHGLAIILQGAHVGLLT